MFFEILNPGHDSRATNKDVSLDDVAEIELIELDDQVGTGKNKEQNC
jgi:hypothetical protein